MSALGGLGPAQPATLEVQAIADKVRPDLETKLGASLSEYVAISYATQLVAGINYFIKVKVDAEAYVHLRVYQNLSNETSLTSYQQGKTLDDPISYF